MDCPLNYDRISHLCRKDDCAWWVEERPRELVVKDGEKEWVEAVGQCAIKKIAEGKR